MLLLFCVLLATAARGEITELRTAIAYDRSSRDSPRIELELFGAPKSFLLDTGAAPSFFFLKNEQAEKLKPFRTPGDGAYAGIPLGGALTGAVISQALPLEDPPFADFKDQYGLFSPQSLTGGTKVVDLQRQEFRYFPNTPAGDIVKRIEQEYGHPLHATKWFGREIKPVPALLVRGRVGTAEAGLLDLDTGSFQTTYNSARIGQIATEPGPRAADIHGNEMASRRSAEALPVFIDDTQAGSTKVTLTSPSEIDTNTMSGTIGADILKDCVLVIPDASEEYLYWYCSAEAPAAK